MQIQKRGVRREVTGHWGREYLMCDAVATEVTPAVKGAVPFEVLNYGSVAVTP